MLVLNAIIAAASVVAAWSSHRSSKAAERASHGAAAGTQAAKTAADAARDSADSMGTAVDRFGEQVRIAEAHLQIVRARYQHVVRTSVTFVGNTEIAVTVENLGDRPFRISAWVWGVATGEPLRMKHDHPRVVRPGHKIRFSFDRSSREVQELQGRTLDGTLYVTLDDGSLHLVDEWRAERFHALFGAE